MNVCAEGRWLRLAAVLSALLIAGCQAGDPDSGADNTTREVKVFTSGGFAAAYDVLAPQFEELTGIVLVTERGASTGGAPDSIPSRLARGEAVDVIILSRSSLDDLTTRGEVVSDSRTDLVRSSIGMAVREGAVKPDISTSETFVATVLSAESIGYSASISGAYLSTVLFPQLGIWDEIEHKSRRIVSERVAAVVARGDVEIGFQQVSEILPIEGADFVGPIPAEHQKISTFSAGVTKRAENPADAQILIEYLSSPGVASAISTTGLEPVALEVKR